MINRLNDDPTPEYFAKLTPRERQEHAIDAAHREMVAYQQEPHCSPERRMHFLRFLCQLEEAAKITREYPLAHSNRVRHTGKGA